MARKPKDAEPSDDTAPLPTTKPATPPNAPKRLNQPRARKGRRARGDGAVFFSAAKDCWIWRAITGHKPDGSVKYTEGRARTQAEGLQRKLAAEKNGTQPNADKETVGDHLDHWLNDIAKPNVRGNTWARYEQVVRLHLKPNIGGVPLRKLSVGQVTKLWAELGREGMGSGTVKTCAEVLASALEAAASEEKITTPPTRAAVKPRVIREEIEVFTDEEVRAILSAAEGDRFEALYAVAVGSGARQGELFALDASDFDLVGGTVRITKMLDQRDGKFIIQPPKSASGTRTIGLPEFATATLRVHLTGRKPGPAFTTKAGTYIAKSNFVRRDWTELLELAGVPYRKFHTLRHTHASRLLAAGVDPAEVAKRIGDRIETVMRVYAHWIPTTGRDTAARVDAIYGKPGPRLASISDPDSSPDSQGGDKVAAG